MIKDATFSKWLWRQEHGDKNTWQWHKWHKHGSLHRGLQLSFSLIPFENPPAQGTSWICTWSVGNPCCSLAWQDTVAICGPYRVNDPHVWIRVEHSKMCGLSYPMYGSIMGFHRSIYWIILNLLLLFNRRNSWGRVCPFMTWNGSCRDRGLLERKVEEHGHHRFGSRTAGTKVETHTERLFLRTTP
jgi:hypothetical protein